MNFDEVLHRRRTTNGYFEAREVSLEHQHALMHAASRAPSHFNSQPWRFVLITDPDKRQAIAEVAGRTMTELMSGGGFFERYKRYFRFSAAEMDERRDGIFIDKLPAPLRPFISKVFSPTGQKIMNSLGVSGRLGKDNAAVVASSPLILAAMLTKDEYQPDQLSGFYSLLGMGMAIENIWLKTVALGMGIQFISTPMEIPGAWAELEQLIDKPDDMELIAMYRLGYVPEQRKRPSIDWSSRHRKRLSQFVFRDSCRQPETDPGQAPEGDS